MVKDCHYVVPKRVGSLIVQGRGLSFLALFLLHCSSEMPSDPSFYTCAFCCVLLSSWNCRQYLLTASAPCVLRGVLIGCLSVPVGMPPSLH